MAVGAARERPLVHPSPGSLPCWHAHSRPSFLLLLLGLLELAAALAAAAGAEDFPRSVGI